MAEAFEQAKCFCEDASQSDRQRLRAVIDRIDGLTKPPVENPSGIHPTEYNVLVKVEEVAEKTKGGIILPDERRDREQAVAMRATIIECSPLAFGYETWPEGAEKPKAGHRVAITKLAGVTLKGKDEADYKLIKDKDVIAILEPADV